MKKILFHTETHYSPALNLGLLLLRFGAGITMAFAHGINKVPPSQNFIGYVAKIGFPMPDLFAWCAGLSELVAALFIAIGVLSRPSALSLVFTMGVAAFVAHGGDPFKKMEPSLIYMLIFLCLFFTGPGKYSIDALINKK